MTYQPPTVPEPPQQPHPGGPYYGPPVVDDARAGHPVPPSGGRKSWLWAVLGGVVVVLLLCCGGTATTLYLFRGEFTAAEEAAEPTARPRFTDDAPRATPAEPIPTPTPPSAPNTLNLKPGQTLVVVSDEGDELEVTIKSPRSSKGCSEYAKPKSGAFLIVDVTMRVTKGKGDISPFDFNFLSPDSTTTDTSGGRVTECGKDLDNGRNMPAGTRRSGQLIFDVKPAKGQIVFKAAGNEIAGSWQIG